MKKALLSIMAFISWTLMYAQNIPVNHKGEAEYVEVGYADSLSKEQLLEISREWFKETFSGNGKTFATSHEIVLAGESQTEPFTYQNGKVAVKNLVFKYTISVHCKNGKYKCIINEIHYNAFKVPGLKKGADLADKQPFDGLSNEVSLQLWKEFRKHADADIRALLQSLRNYMQGQPMSRQEK